MVSCIPYPHKVRSFPEIYGQISSNSFAKYNLEVTYTDDRDVDPCSENVKSVRTNKEGEFIIPAEYEEAKYLSLGMVHYLREWHLCFKDTFNQYKWSDNFYGPDDAPGLLILSCDTSNSPVCRSTNVSR